MASKLNRAFGIFVAVTVVLTSVKVADAASASWTPTSGGPYNWDTNATPPWNTGSFPNGVGDVATMQLNISANIAIDLNQTITLGALNLGDTGSGTDRGFTYNTGSGGTGFLFDNGGSNASISKNNSGAAGANANVFNADITIGGNGQLNVATTSTGGGQIDLRGVLKGGNTTTLNYTATAMLLNVYNDLTQFTGTYNITLNNSTITFFGSVDGSNLAIPNTQDASANAFIVNNGTGSGTLRWGENGANKTPTTFKMGSLSGNGNLRNEGNHPTTLQVGYLNTSTTYSGVLHNGGQGPGNPAPGSGNGIADERVSLEKVGSGTLTLTGNNLYQGVTTVTGGTLLVNGNHVMSGLDGDGNPVTAGNYTVGGGATLGGSGTITQNVTVNGNLAPGNSIGTFSIRALTFGGTGSQLLYDMASGSLQADLTNANGNLLINPGTQLSITDTPSALVPMGTKFTVISYSGNWIPGVNGVNVFSGKPNGSTFVEGPNKWLIRYDSTPTGSLNGGAYANAVSLTAVPEMGSVFIMGVGGIFAIGGIWLGRRHGIAVLGFERNKN